MLKTFYSKNFQEAISGRFVFIDNDCLNHVYNHAENPLSVPFDLREQRLHQRGPHSLIDLEKNQKERDAIKIWPGYIYGNINSSKEDAEKLYKLIQDNKGLLNLSEIKLNS